MSRVNYAGGWWGGVGGQSSHLRRFAQKVTICPGSQNMSPLSDDLPGSEDLPPMNDDLPRKRGFGIVAIFVSPLYMCKVKRFP